MKEITNFRTENRWLPGYYNSVTVAILEDKREFLLPTGPTSEFALYEVGDDVVVSAIDRRLPSITVEVCGGPDYRYVHVQESEASQILDEADESEEDPLLFVAKRFTAPLIE